MSYAALGQNYVPPPGYMQPTPPSSSADPLTGPLDWDPGQSPSVVPGGPALAPSYDDPRYADPSDPRFTDPGEPTPSGPSGGYAPYPSSAPSSGSATQQASMLGGTGGWILLGVVAAGVGWLVWKGR